MLLFKSGVLSFLLLIGHDLPVFPSIMASLSPDNHKGKPNSMLV